MSDYRLFDTFQDAVLVIDGEGNLHYGNPAASLLFEVSARRMSSGKPLSQFVTFQPDPFEAAGELYAVIEATQVKEVEFNASGGKVGWAQVSFQPQPEFFATNEEEKMRWIVCLRDVSLEKTLHDKYKAELDKKEAVIQDLREARAKLEDYSRNLEKMVEARTAELREANRLLKTILDSLGQGILVFDSEGRCLPIFSLVCRDILEAEPAGQPIDDVLRLSDGDRATFTSWREAVFAQMLDFEDLIPLAPSKFEHSMGREISLSYNPMRDGDGQIQGVVLVATDRTREVEALREAAREREVVRRVVQVARNREAFRVFVADAKRLLQELQNLKGFDREELARQLHTLKGGAGSFALGEIVSAAHHLEETLKDGVSAENEAEFAAKLASEAKSMEHALETALNAITELLGPLGTGSAVKVVEVPVEKFQQWSMDLFDVTTPEQARIIGLDILKQCFEKPAGDSIRHLEPSLKELADSLGKKLSGLVIEGGDLRLPDEAFRPLFSSLVHAFRNSIDHGLEKPEDRVAAGKSAEGTIRVQFQEQAVGNVRYLSIRINDDGRGVDPSKVRDKLVRLGRQDLAAAPDAEVIQAILRDDFSTAETVSEISGRGVGLSAIAAEVKRMGGAIVVVSEKGRGMGLMMRVPIPDLMSRAALKSVA